MAHGLMWLPLLAIFFWLSWAGWNEYQKVEAYRSWASQFDRAKYDIYAVLGQKGSDITWGKPTRKGPIELTSFSLGEVKNIHLLIDDRMADLQNLPDKGRAIALEFQLSDSTEPIKVPFTEISLAAEWAKHLQQDLIK